MKMKPSMIILAVLLAAVAVVPFTVFQGCGSDPYTVPKAAALTGAATVAINGSAAVTFVTEVTLTLHAEDSDNVAAYYVSENSTTPAAADAGWVAITPAATTYDGTQSFTLSAGYGIKTVNAWFKDANGVVSEKASDSINYMQTGGS